MLRKPMFTMTEREFRGATKLACAAQLRGGLDRAVQSADRDGGGEFGFIKVDLVGREASRPELDPVLKLLRS